MTRSRNIIFILSILAVLPIAVFARDEGIWLVVGDEKLQEGAKALMEYRRQEGFDIRVAEAPVRQAIERLGEVPAYIVLLGDDDLGDGADTEGMLQGERKSLYRWQQTQAETFISDAVFGDTDGDEVPDIPVGRLPGRTPEMIERLANKIVEYEKRAVTRDALRLPVWAGNPAYGDHFQANVASNLLRQTLHAQAPAWADLCLVMGNDTDPLSADPGKQAELFHESLEQGGGLFTGLMGHGGVEAFYSMPVGTRWVTYHRSQTAALSSLSASSPAIIFACDCGNFAERDQSLAEALLGASGGPVAVIAATTQSHPLPNYYSSLCWLQELSQGTPRLGAAWVASQKKGFKKRDFLVELALANIEGSVGGKLDTPRIRQDHLLLYALLGDPATRLKQPLTLKATFEREGDEWHWSVDDPPPHATRWQLAHRGPPPPLKPKPRGLAVDDAMALYRQASAELQFQELAVLNQPQVWRGSAVHQRGTLRLVVEAAGQIYVATQEMREP